MLQWWTDVFSQAQQWLFEAVVQPVVFALGMGNLLEDAFSATGWLLVGLIQIAVMLALIAPLQRWRPVEAVTDRAAIRTDILYTLIHRLGLFRLVLFFALDPLFDTLFGLARVSSIVEGIKDTVGGRLVVFFPGEYHPENHAYRLLDARDGWNYLAVPLLAKEA